MKSQQAQPADASLEGLAREIARRVESSESEEDIEQIRIDYLGRKEGRLTVLLRSLKDFPESERRQRGAELNRIRSALQQSLEAKSKKLRERIKDELLQEERVDVTLPGIRFERGHLHPLTQVMDEIVDIFTAMGFEIARGPDIEDDYHNFEALNIPADHPAREMQDTFFVTTEQVLRTHTSPVQIRTMENRQPPLQIIAPGAVYRHDDDATHSPMFHQVEGFMVDHEITFGDLKGVLTHFLREIFHDQLRVRFRPSFFPFTEPSAEVDIGCIICAGDRSSETCRVCKGSGWLEILGAGMIDPNVFRFVGYDPEIFSGFAFGMGVERITMLKYGIEDIRSFFQNDIRFLEQF